MDGKSCLEKLKFAASLVLGFMCLFSLSFCVAFALYFSLVDLILFPIVVYEFPDFAAFMISPIFRCVVCSGVAILAVLTPKG